MITPGVPPLPVEAAGSWRDRIVDLHVLAENGDPDAAATARQWLDRDAEARRVWDEVEQTCDRIRRT
ncbi:hypothetical protein [Pseudonocardia sp. GCM10023141]|uniref:hypothetical protein n=1 Tax=Pseudonocardia sp. GCM10023141 TaxID=3252653 RepID=UPI0036225528